MTKNINNYKQSKLDNFTVKIMRFFIKKTSSDNWRLTDFPILGVIFVNFGILVWYPKHILMGAWIAIIISMYLMVGYWAVLSKIKILRASIAFYISYLVLTAWQPLALGREFWYLSIEHAVYLAFSSPVFFIVGYWLQPFDLQKTWYRRTFVFCAVVILVFISNPLIIIVPIVICVMLLSLWQGGGSVYKHKPDLLSGETVSRGVINLLGKEKNKQQGVWCGSVSGKNIYTSIEDRAVVIGPPGTGKTAFLVTQLLQWANSGRPFICLDIKPEIYEIVQRKLKRQGYTLYQYSPTLPGKHKYNPLDDIDSPESISELAAALITSESSSDAVFNETARDFMAAMLLHLDAIGEASLPKMQTLLNDSESYSNLLSTLANSPSAKSRALANALALTASNERLLGSIFATFRANTRFLFWDSISTSLEKSDFTLKELCNGKPVGLFLQFAEQHAETTGRLQSMIVGHIMRYLISHTDRPAVLQLFDEIGNAPQIIGLTQKLNTIRSRNLPTWLYWQSVEQMQKYGKKSDEGVNTILGACDFQMVFRLNDNATAEWMSKRIGTVDRQIDNVSETHGEEISMSYSFSLVEEPKVYPHEFQQLKTSAAICVYRGVAWRNYAVPYFVKYKEYARE